MSSLVHYRKSWLDKTSETGKTSCSKSHNKNGKILIDQRFDYSHIASRAEATSLGISPMFDVIVCSCVVRHGSSFK